ncbi:putative nerve growth factor [Triplophysa rosa]|uniref:Nerve growth factor n=1 Tax=Triplophysa rosa TaxID=992332 RepID=A0A9W7WS74_TRIRA|nr:putative nerve growth factor [Triplophysa rosa]
MPGAGPHFTDFKDPTMPKWLFSTHDNYFKESKLEYSLPMHCLHRYQTWFNASADTVQNNVQRANKRHLRLRIPSKLERAACSKVDVASAQLVHRLRASTKPRFISASCPPGTGIHRPVEAVDKAVCVCGLDGLTLHVGTDATQTLLRGAGPIRCHAGQYMCHEERRRSMLKPNILKHLETFHSEMFAQRPGDVCPQNGHRDVTSNSAPTVDPKLFNKRRYRSPRVLFSELPPDSEPRSRAKRRAGQPQHRGVYSVCESVSLWVGNKTKATDISGNEVTVLPDVNINNINKKQYFFETTCSGGRTGGSGCLGIDARHWNSYCTNSHTFVRALTSFKNLVAWRLIRINVACVCVLSRKSWRQ